jgi:hypothetical protein
METARDETRAVFIFADDIFCPADARVAQSRRFKGFVKVNRSRCHLGFQNVP